MYESSFSTDHLTGATQYVTRHRWTGMVHPSWLQTAVESVRSECCLNAVKVLGGWVFHCPRGTLQG